MNTTANDIFGFAALYNGTSGANESMPGTYPGIWPGGPMEPRCRQLHHSVPSYQIVLETMAIEGLIAIIVSIAYAVREHRRSKKYVLEGEENVPEEEKLEKEADVQGECMDKIRVVHSERNIEEPVSARTTSETALKVMVRKRKARSREDSPPPLPGPIKVKLIVDMDRTLRGEEFVQLLENAILEAEEFKDAKFVREEEQEKLCEFLVRKLRAKLEQSTIDKWVVHGTIQDRLWKVSGQKNLLGVHAASMVLMMRLSTKGIKDTITTLAYKIDAESQRAPERNKRHPKASLTSASSQTPAVGDKEKPPLPDVSSKTAQKASASNKTSAKHSISEGGGSPRGATRDTQSSD